MDPRHDKITSADFEALLRWLDPNRDAAGRAYERIRSRLIKIFEYRGCGTPEDLADETIDRVAGKIGQLRYSGDPALYFYGVANKIFLEYQRRKPLTLLPVVNADPSEVEIRSQCLDECMNQLMPEQRELILAYYAENKKKAAARNALAERLGIGANALWIRTHRIRESLRRCVLECFRKRTT